MFELIYTSVPRGLLPGRSGFTTAAMTAGMPPNLIVPLENSSGYNFTFLNGELPGEYNPVCCCYFKMRYGNQILPIISRIAPNGLDYTRRNNKIAHHILLENTDEISAFAGGAAELFMNEDLFCTAYDIEPMELPFRQLPTAVSRQLLPAVFWQRITGDCGYAAWIAEKFRSNPQQCVYVKYPLGTDEKTLLNLTMEICCLLDDEEKNNFTFSTYFRSSNTAEECFLRFIPDFSPLYKSLKQLRSNFLLDLDSPLPLPSDICSGELYRFARDGKPQTQVPQAVQQLLETSAAVEHTQKMRIIEQQNPHSPDMQQMPSRTKKRVSYQMPSAADNDIHTSNRQQLFAGIIVLFLVLILGLIWALNYDSKNISEQETVTAATAVSSETAKPPMAAAAASKPAAGGTADRPTPQLTSPIDKKSAARQGSEKSAPIRNSGKKVSDTKISDSSSGQDNRPLLTSANLKKLKTEGALKLLVDYQDVDFSTKKTSLQLPAQLINTTRIDIEISKIGHITDNIKNFIKNTAPLSIEISGGDRQAFPLRAKTSSDNTHGRLNIEYIQNNNTLQFQIMGDTADCIMIKPEQITAFYFRTPQGDYRWPTRIIPEYTSKIPRGHIDIIETGGFIYLPHDFYSKLKNHLYVMVGGYSAKTLTSRILQYGDWNSAVDAYLKQEKVCREIQTAIKKLHRTNLNMPSPKELKEFVEKIDGESEKVTLKKLDKMLTDFLKRFYGQPTTPLPQPSETADVLEELIEKIGKKLDVEKFNKQQKAQYEQAEEIWEKDISQIKKYIENWHEYTEAKKILNQRIKELQHAKQKIMFIMENLGDKFVNMMNKMMMTAPAKGQAPQPRKITLADLRKLSGEITQSIKIYIAEDNYQE